MITKSSTEQRFVKSIDDEIITWFCPNNDKTLGSRNISRIVKVKLEIWNI